MSYITQAQLEQRFGGGDLRSWTDDDASGVIDAGVVAEAIAVADGAIDQAAAQHYATPLRLSHVGTGAMVRLIAGSIAGYLLASRKGQVNQNLRQMYEDAQQWLADLAAGKRTLAGESTAAVPRPSGGIVIAGSAAVVDRQTMDGL